MKFILLVPDICKYDILSLKYGMKILLNLKTECLKRLSRCNLILEFAHTQMSSFPYYIIWMQ